MKRSISLVLCLAMLISVFSCIGVSASAADEQTVDVKELFTIKSSGFKNDKITYTVYLNSGLSFYASIIRVDFDEDVLAVDQANTGAYMVDDGDGGETESIGGMYETGFTAGNSNQYSVAHIYSADRDYKSGSSDKAYMKFTFKAVDRNRPATTVKFTCAEFKSISAPENNVDNGKPGTILSDTRTTLGQVAIDSVVSEKDGVRINWKKVTGADFYRVYKIANGEDTLIKSTADGDELTYLDTSVENNKKYTYAVRAVNEASDEGYAATRSSTASTRYTVAPATLKVANGEGEVVVSWSKVEGATSYRVYRRTVDADGDVTAWKYLSGKITDLKFADTTAKSGTKYEYAVRVYSDGGNSDLYSEKDIICLGTPDFSIEATVKGVKITWGKVSGAESYKIYRKVSDGSWKTIKTVSSSTTSYTDTSASSGKTNSYKIVAVNGSYNSDYETHKVYYLKTPTVSVKNTTSGVYTSWKKVSGASSYYVYRKAGSAKSWTKIATTKKTSYTDKNVKSGTTYKYTIRAVNSKGKSKYGSTAYETIRFLSAPKLENIKSTKSGVTVYWDDVKGASKYHIYRKTGSGDYELIKTVSGRTTVKYLDKTAKKGKTYTYKVYAGYSSYKSSYKSTLSIKDKY
ncbi:MAG: hypothetical protein E7529_05100 [Ruminococcaceae bacterium]|nr:hypothetical protein [Oscillospiraceae bacterium]